MGGGIEEEWTERQLDNKIKMRRNQRSTRKRQTLGEKKGRERVQETRKMG